MRISCVAPSTALAAFRSESFYSLYLERIGHLRKQGITAGWAGVF